jgi:hypothetical protein
LKSSQNLPKEAKLLFFQKKPKTNLVPRVFHVVARELRKTLGTRLAKNNSFLEPAFPLACGGISFPPQDKGNTGSENEIEPKRVHYGKLVAGLLIPRLSNQYLPLNLGSP